jgi:hypothetical protein
MDEELTAGEEPTAGQISRRKALKRIGAGAAAAAWSAPLLSSLRTPAFAASPRCQQGFVCLQVPENCGSDGLSPCNCTSTVDGSECLSDRCDPTLAACTTNAECETRLGPGARCQPLGTGCCGNTCIYPCATPTGRLAALADGPRNSG